MDHTWTGGKPLRALVLEGPAIRVANQPLQIASEQDSSRVVPKDDPPTTTTTTTTSPPAPPPTPTAPSNPCPNPGFNPDNSTHC